MSDQRVVALLALVEQLDARLEQTGFAPDTLVRGQVVAIRRAIEELAPDVVPAAARHGQGA